MTSRLLIVSHEAPDERMSGPAIRYWHLAQALAATLRVTLAVPAPVTLDGGRVRVLGYARAGAELPALLADSDVVLVAGYLLRHFPVLARTALPLVVDLYDPFLLENLQIHAPAPLPDQAALQRVDLDVLAEQLRRGDFFLCASETQRDFWLGMLAAHGRLNPHNFRADPAFRRLIAVVPFGLPDDPPSTQAPALKGVWPGIGPADSVLYWGGGIWDWFDPLTAIHAIAALAARRPTVRLFFGGLRHPNPAVPAMRQAAAAQGLSASLGLTGRHVFFNDGWIPYARRSDFLLDADVGLSLHLDHVETRFAYRTRLLDYLWAGLPMVLSSGDSLSAELAAHDLARAVAPGDVAGVAAAVETWLDEAAAQRQQRQARARALAAEHRWSRVVAPLLAFASQPAPAPDRVAAPARPSLAPGLLAKAWHSLRTRGPAALLRDIRLYLGR
jgi:hypothetical protein